MPIINTFSSGSIRGFSNAAPVAAPAGNVKWVALVGGLSTSSNIAAYSPDGITWAQTTLPANVRWQSVAYGNGTYVAVSGGFANSSVAATSSDGINWIQRTLSSDQYWTRVAYGNGVFVVVGGVSSATRTNIVSRSTDNGVTWSNASITSAAWSSVTYGNGVFSAVAGYNDGNLGAPILHGSSNNNGATWITTVPRVSNRVYRVVGYGEANGSNIFIAISAVGSFGTYSTTGLGIRLDWDNLNGNVALYPSPLSNPQLAYGNGTFVAVSGNRIVSSTDANNWVYSSNGVYNNLSCIAYGDGQFVAIAGGLSSSNVVIRSPDGINWSNSVMPSSSRWISVAYGG